MGLEISSERIDPVKPTTSEKASSAPTSMPLSLRNRFSPSTLMTIDSNTMTAMLVARNRKMRFMDTLLALKR